MAQIRALRRVASLLTTPLAPEDFLGLVNPLSSTRQLRGIVTRVVPETADSATIHFRPGKGWNAHQAGQWARIGVEMPKELPGVWSLGVPIWLQSMRAAWVRFPETRGLLGNLGTGILDALPVKPCVEASLLDFAILSTMRS